MKSPWLALCVIVAIAFLGITPANPDEPEKAPSKPDAADPFIGKEAGQVRNDNDLKMKLVWCPPGFVTMQNVEFITEPATKKKVKSNDDEVDPKNEPAPKPRQTEKITPIK